MSGRDGLDGLGGLSREDLRAAVRAVLREVLPEAGGAGSHAVTIATDADLTAFVRRVAAMCEDAEVRASLQAGTHGFRLSPGGGGAATVAGQPPRPPGVVRVERGAVTERTVAKAAAEGSRLLLGRGAVLTPLARDKARALGVEIEKER